MDPLAVCRADKPAIRYAGEECFFHWIQNGRIIQSLEIVMVGNHHFTSDFRGKDTLFRGGIRIYGALDDTNIRLKGLA